MTKLELLEERHAQVTRDIEILSMSIPLIGKPNLSEREKEIISEAETILLQDKFMNV